MFRLRGRDWIILTAFGVAGVVVGDVVYNKWAGPRFEEGLRRTEADMKSNLPLRVDQNTTLVDVKYDRTRNAYWYVIDKVDQFDAQETARQVQIGVCTNAENSSTMKKEGFSYEYHYRTKDGLALTDFKVTTCE
jgi:imidazolonepropionase-like amidohydrolase